jgi:hypothetical protein
MIILIGGGRSQKQTFGIFGPFFLCKPNQITANQIKKSYICSILEFAAQDLVNHKKITKKSVFDFIDPQYFRIIDKTSSTILSQIT